MYSLFGTLVRVALVHFGLVASLLVHQNDGAQDEHLGANAQERPQCRQLACVWMGNSCSEASNGAGAQRLTLDAHVGRLHGQLVAGVAVPDGIVGAGAIVEVAILDHGTLDGQHGVLDAVRVGGQNVVVGGLGVRGVSCAQWEYC